MFFFEVPLSLFCEKKQTKTIITSDMILLLLLSLQIHYYDDDDARFIRRSE